MRPKERRTRTLSDPTAEEALAHISQQSKVTSILEARNVTPLSKFENDTDWKGRRKLLRGLHRELSKTKRGDTETRSRILNEIRELSVQQFISRVSPGEARMYAGRRIF